MLRFKIFLRYTAFWIFFVICFAVMFVFLTAAIMGVTSGVMLAVLGTAIIMFKAGFIISGLAPEIMLFGGLCGACFTAFLGMTAIKLGFVVSRVFLKIKHQCDKLRDSEYVSEAAEFADEQVDDG